MKGPTGDASRVGFVYVLINRSFPDMVKLGKTTVNAASRASQLSRHTGVPTEFVVAYDELVSDCSAVEYALHERFSASRVSGKREFFRVPLRDAIMAMQGEARKHPLDPRTEHRIDVLRPFEERCRRWLKRDIIGMFLVQYPGIVTLEVIRQPAPSLNDVVTERVDLGFILDGDETFYFPSTVAPDENAKRLLGLDSYTIIMTLPIFADDAADFIDRMYRDTGRDPFHPPPCQVGRAHCLRIAEVAATSLLVQVMGEQSCA